jgi:carbon monoxide dehydrogenase subunit G
VKIDARYLILAPRERVFDLLVDPDVLARTLPGCEQLARIDDTHFDATLKVGVAGVKGTYRGTAAIENAVRPSRLTLVVDGKGAGAFVRGRGEVVLNDELDGGTMLLVNGDAQVGGLLATVGQRLIASGARLLMNDFFQAIQREAVSTPS